MNQQKTFKEVHYWADYHLVASGNQCRLIDNHTKQNLLAFAAQTASEAKQKCCQFLRYGRAA
jgi:hypothetical protein